MGPKINLNDSEKEQLILCFDEIKNENGSLKRDIPIRFHQKTNKEFSYSFLKNTYDKIVAEKQRSSNYLEYYLYLRMIELTAVIF